MVQRQTSRLGQPVLPTPERMAHAKDLLSHLDGQHRFVLLDGENHEIKLDEDIVDLLRCILIDLSQNRAVQILPHDMELTTIQAAAFLQVSRPHLLKMIKAGEFSCRLVGTHRRIKLNDLMGYRAKVDAASTAARAQITQEAEEHGWGY